MIARRIFQIVFILTAVLIFQNAMSAERIGTAGSPVPILLYHRFGPTPADSMTVTDQVFLSHLEYLKSNGYKVIPLQQAVDCIIRKVPAPERSVAIVADDGHKSIYTNMLPIVRKYRIPVTLFIYPSAVSNASYAMTWDELCELQKSGLFDIQSHTFWHPNFKKEKKRLSAYEYEQFVSMQLIKSKARLEKELGKRVDMLAWPFGIYDDDLMKKAREAGYIAAFTIEHKCGERGDNSMKLSRYLLTNAHRGKKFEMIFTGNGCPAAKGGLRK